MFLLDQLEKYTLFTLKCKSSHVITTVVPSYLSCVYLYLASYSQIPTFKMLQDTTSTHVGNKGSQFKSRTTPGCINSQSITSISKQEAMTGKQVQPIQSL